MTDAEAQQQLNDGICPQCGADIIEGGDYDDIDGYVYLQTYFACSGKARHHYAAEKDGIGGRYPLWEGIDESSPRTLAT